MPGDVLLSHGETPHYHRRRTVSLPSSRWDRVGHIRYGRQANWHVYRLTIVIAYIQILEMHSIQVYVYSVTNRVTQYA